MEDTLDNALAPIEESINKAKTYSADSMVNNDVAELKMRDGDIVHQVDHGNGVATFRTESKRVAQTLFQDLGYEVSDFMTDAAEGMGYVGFGQASNQYNFAPKAQLTATIDNWSPYYIRKVGQVLDGTWETGTYFGDISECDHTGCAVGMAPFANMPDNVKAKAEEIKAAITAGEYFAFKGPLYDNEGNLQLAEGEIADRAHLDSMAYYVEGIVSKVPR